MVFGQGSWEVVDVGDYAGIGCPPRVWCPQEWLEEAMKVLEEEMFSDPEKFGLVRRRGRGNHILLPEEGKALDSLHLYYDTEKTGEEWMSDTDVYHRELWDHYEMSDDMDDFILDCDEKEARLNFQAGSPLPFGEYFIPNQRIAWGERISQARKSELYHMGQDILDEWEEKMHRDTIDWESKITEDIQKNPEPWCIGSVFMGGRVESHPPGIMKPSPSLDAKDRMLVDAVITKHGHKFHQARCDKGKIFIDLKFTAYVPEVGGTVKMFVQMKSVDKAYPLICRRIL